MHWDAALRFTGFHVNDLESRISWRVLVLSDIEYKHSDIILSICEGARLVESL